MYVYMYTTTIVIMRYMRYMGLIRREHSEGLVPGKGGSYIYIIIYMGSPLSQMSHPALGDDVKDFVAGIV